MEQHPHDVEEVGQYTVVTGESSAIIYAVEWCPVCREAYTRPTLFVDGVRWTAEQREAARRAERDGRAACAAAIQRRREEAAKEEGHA